MEWQHVVLEPFEDDPDDSESLEYDRLEAGLFAIDILYLENGKFFVEQNDGNEETIGHADTLEEARQLARRWLVDRAADLLDAAGAEGIWQLRGAGYAELRWAFAEIGLWDASQERLLIEPPHETIMLVRFPTGDGREPGIEYW